MRLDDLWYNVYEVGPARVISEVDIIVMRHVLPESSPLPGSHNSTAGGHGGGPCAAAQQGSSLVTERLQVGSNNRRAHSSDNAVVVSSAPRVRLISCPTRRLAERTLFVLVPGGHPSLPPPL